MLTSRAHRITLLGPMPVYQIIWDRQCLNDLRDMIYDLGTLTTWFSNEFVSSEIYEKRDGFHFDIVFFRFEMGTLPLLPLTALFTC